MNFIVTHSGLIVSVLFFTMFSIIALWSYLPRNKQRLQSYAHIPLGDDHD
ncbi:MAG: cbb3-type cytochrome c oxidase subunit 3 [Pseudomonadota bacterium]|nr:cbb3-type cytochrome c oxidase subunit 3 [Pseudomonadota bacterium]